MTRRTTLAVWVALFALYAMTCARVLAPADSPEFLALMVHGGFAHPPGSPTTVLLYKLFAWLPFDPPFAGGIATAVIGAAALGLLYRACRAWGLDRPSSTIAMALVGLHSQVWLVHTHPEAFAANNLFAAAILLFSAPDAPCRGLRRVAILGALAGLGLGAHQSLVLLAPVGLWGVWTGFEESDRSWLSLAAGAATLALGLGVYGTMLLWDSPVSFGRIETLDDVLHHLLRKDYGTTSLSAKGTAGPFDQLRFWVVETFADSGVVGLALLALGLLQFRQAAEPKSGWRALAVTWLLCGPIFIAILNINPEGPRAEMVKRFHVLPMFVGAPFIAIATMWLQRLTISPVIKGVAAAGTVGLLLMTGGVRTAAVYGGALEDSLRNTLRTLPSGAIIMGQGDHRYFGWQYLQNVEGVRPDVVAIEPSALAYPWYVDRMRTRLDVDIPYAGERIELQEILELMLAETDRPVFVTRDFAPKILKQYIMVPDGPAWRVLRTSEREPPVADLYAHSRAAFDQFVHRGAPPEYVIDPWGWSLFRSHTLLWEDLLARCEAAKAECAQPARAMLERYPDL